MSILDALDPRYRLVLCDIWGCIHDGVSLYPGAAERLTGWRREGRTVVLVTNAPRTADAVERQLQRLGLPRQAWVGIATSGEAGIAALSLLDSRPGFLGTSEDRAILETRGIAFAAGQDFTDLACTGLDEARHTIAEYSIELMSWAERGVVMHCLNPDRVVIYGGRAEPCAGAIADAYQALGGKVRWYGKPDSAIYQHALALGGNPSPRQVLAIGDGLATDVLGAMRHGIDCVFVKGGIHSGEPFPADFATAHGHSGWRPVGIVEGLGR